MPDAAAFCETCAKLAAILAGKSQCQDTVCVVTVDRTNLDATILGRQTRAGELLGMTVIFESPGEDGQTLNTLEATLLQREVRRFVRVLQRFGIEVSALHNHWLFEHPRLTYLHAEAIDAPIAFAQAVAQAIQTLIVPPVESSPPT